LENEASDLNDFKAVNSTREEIGVST